MNDKRLAEQGKLLDGIMEELGTRSAASTRPCGTLFRNLAICVLYEFDRPHAIASDFDSDCLFVNIVEPRIREFTKANEDDGERRFLLAELLDRIQPMATNDLKKAYHPRLIAA